MLTLVFALPTSLELLLETMTGRFYGLELIIYILWPLSPLAAELTAIRAGVHLAVEKKLPKICIALDCLAAIQLINSKFRVPFMVLIMRAKTFP
ncbi:hypothetical protein G4B88_018651 [Cannabis sativa]|uniref:RNase H type-1 domain-containing protein n=1 Tax=Cannabis sativa TaxID=3483 RepID=A0A7J6HHQ8_CANSA|nr:hypothetical protein G4B88_018651 [Cannabis sativa]